MTRPKRICLHHEQPKRKQWKVYTFDIETMPDGELIVGGIGDIELFERYYTYYEIFARLWELNDKNVRFLAHWADGMEFPHLIKFIRNHPQLRERYNLEPTYSGMRMVKIDIIDRAQKRRKLVILDTWALSGVSLERWSKNFGGDYRKEKDIDFAAGEVYSDDNPLHVAYLQRDLQSTVASYLNMSKIVYELFGSNLGITAASTAMKAFKASLPKDVKYFRLYGNTEEFVRGAYYGGYVTPGHDTSVHLNVVSRDITGAYGFHMKTKLFPVGNPVFTNVFIPGLPGIYRCLVRAINPPFAMCPYRDEKGILHWLLEGHCITTITAAEINYFVQHGYLVQIIEGCYFEKEASIFQAFMENCERLEQLGGVYKDVAKLMRNSLYGRFGTRKTITRVICTDNPPENAIQVCNPKNGYPIEDLWEVEDTIDAEYIQPHWASYVTAYERLCLFDMILRVGVENVLGADTDSIKLEKEIDDSFSWSVPYYYGSTHIEAHFDLYRSIGPKLYVTQKDAKYALKAKGIRQQVLNKEGKEVAISQDVLKAYMESDTKEELQFKSNTKGLRMLASDGLEPLLVKRKRTLSTLNSQTWELRGKLFYPIAPGKKRVA